MVEAAIFTDQVEPKRWLTGRNGPLPRIEAGQIWIIEQIAGAPLSLGPDALANANVLLYDRPLAPLVGEILPVGAYAEPLASNIGTASAAISPRALQFAADGWSVVQLVGACPSFRDRLQIAFKELIQKARFHDLPALLITRAVVDRYRGCETSLCTLPELIHEANEAELLIVIFGPLGDRSPRSVCAWNGLAG
jgi:hypothetical protein